MKTKLLTVIIGFLLLACYGYGQRGITNNGAKIIVTSGGIINITGGTYADYTNKTSGSTHGRIDLDGKIKLEGDWTNNATSGSVLINVDTDGEVAFTGNTAQAIGGTASTQFEKLTINNSTGGVSLSANVDVSSTLTLTNGLLTLGTKNLTLAATSTVSGTPSATKMVVATGTGEFRKTFSAIGSFTYPIGDNTVTAEYSPVTLNFTSGTFGGSAYAGTRLTDAKHPNNTTTGAYITRYWSLSQSNITGFSCTVTGNYLDADINGTETNMFAGYWSSPNWVKMNAANAPANQLSGTISVFYDITAGDQAMFCASSPTIAYTQTNVSCNGGSNGTIDLTVSGGLAPYIYSWSTVGGSGLVDGVQDQTGLTTGAYYVTVTDQNACSANQSITITQPTVLSSTITGTDPTCYNGTNGSVNLSPSGGTPAYTFLWSNSQNTEDISGLTASTYSVTITDTKGCTATNSTTLGQPTQITTSITKADVSCNGGSNGSADLTVSGGTPGPGYLYSWSNLATTQDISGLTANTYTVTVTDNNGCTVTNNITINQPSGLTLTTVVTNVSCFGGNNGAINLTVAGGTSPYQYNWSNSATIEDISSLTAGSYTVTVTDANSCTATKTTSVTQPALLTASITGTNVSCFGGANGAANLTVAGGTSPYAYSWSNLATTEDLTGLTAGNYSVTVTDSKSCTASNTVNITQPPALTLTITGTNVSCNGGSNGSAATTVTGGTAPYSYNWSSGQSTGNISGLTAGTYTLTVTDFKGCTISNNVVITQPAVLGATIAGTDANCYGSSDGAANLTVSGGTTPYDYSWSNSATIEDISGLVAGNYSVTVTDDHNCTTAASTTIGQPTEITLTTNKTDATCENSDGSATVSAAGGSGLYINYDWSPNGYTGDGTPNYINIPAGTYYVTVTDSDGCTADISVNVSEVGAPSISIIAFTNVSCFGGNNGSATVQVSAGTPDYTFVWSTGTTVTQTGTTYTETGLAAGTHSVTVTDNGLCSANTTVNITQPTQLTSTISKTNVTCNGGNNGTATVAPSGGIGPYTYLWSDNQTTQTATNLVAATYSVIITDANSCTLVKSTTVVQPAALTATIAGTNILCNGDADGAANLTVTGGTSPYGFYWSTTDNTEDISGLTAGSYTVTVTDGNGCTATAGITISEPTALVASITGTDVSCNGGNDGEADLTVTGGTLSYSFSWSNSATTEDLLNVTADNYAVTVTDGNNCQATASLTISEPSAITAILTPANVTCNGGNNGNIEITVSGGTPTYTYNWSNSSTTANIYGLTSGSYTLTITDSGGCTYVGVTTVTQPSAITASTVPTNVSCFGGSNGAVNISVSGGTAPYTYVWSNSETTEDISNLTAGPFSVTITDFNGCSLVNSSNVAQPNELVVAIAGQNVSCFGLSNGSATITVTGGTPNYSYNWSSGQTTGNISGLPAGTYSLTVTDANSCNDIESITITEPALLTSSVSGTDATCFGVPTGTIALSVSGGITQYSYIWSNAVTTEDQSAVEAGIYYVTVFDDNNCQVFDTISISQPDEIVIQLVPLHIACYGETTGEVDLTVSGGVVPYDFEWSNAATTEDIGSLDNGIYYITITDLNNCFVIDSIEITEPEALIASITVYNVDCNSSSTGAADLSVTGGTPTYTYLWSNGETLATNSGLIAGTYYITVTDFNNCVTNDSATISEPEIIAINGTVTDPTCFNGSDGSIDISVTGGILPYAYNWNSGNTSADITGLTAGSYVITITDDNNCIMTSTIAVTEPPQIVLSSSTVLAHCNTADGEATVIISSGGVAPFNYIWDDPSAQTNETATGLFAGTYHVTVTDADGCFATNTIILTNFNSPVASIDTVVNATCFGSCDGQISILVSDGTLPYSYLWNDPNGQTTQTATDLCAGSYTIIVSDSTGCQATATASISAPAGLIVNISHTDVICNSNCNGTATASVSGGTSPYDYSWSSTDSTANISDLCAGIYYLTANDIYGCSIIDSVQILEPEILQTVVSGTDISCYGNADGAASLSISGGTSPYAIFWSDSSTVENLSNLTAGLYYVTVTDAEGCITSDSVSISEPDSLYITMAVTDILCNGLSTGEVALSVFGGTSPYIYSWSNGDTGEDIINLPSGNYLVTVTDAHGCVVSAGATVTEPDALLITYIVTPEVSNNGAIDITVNGGTVPYTFSWSNGESSEDINNLAQGIYTITITDGNGCTADETILVNNIVCALVLTLTSTEPLCYGAVNGEAIATISNGTEPYTYLWSIGDTTLGITGIAAGSYSVTVEDSTGCIAIDTIVIGEPPQLVVSAYGTDITCNGNNDGQAEAFISGGTSPYSLLWNTGSSAVSLNNLSAAAYTLTVTDANGCEVTGSITLTEPEVLNLTYIVTEEISGNDGAIDITVTGGILPYSFLWSTSETTEDLTGLAAGVYTVTVSDSNLCQVIQPVNVTNAACSLALSVTGFDLLCNGDNSGIAVVVASSGTEPYSYQWSDPLSQTTDTATGLDVGIYYITVTDDSGCVELGVVEIFEPALLEATISGTDVVCYGGITGAADLSVTGGTAPYSYLWAAGETDEDLITLTAGYYAVTVIDTNNCEAYTDITIGEPEALSLSYIVTNEVSGNDGAIDLTVTGGITPYAFAWSNGESTEDIAGLTGDDYTVDVTDANGCIISETITVSSLLCNMTLTTTGTDLLCNSDYSGTATAIAENGMEPYSYLWSIGLWTPTITGLSAGTYYVTVTDSAACTLSDSVTITEPDALVATIAGTDASCYGTTGAADLTVNGGIPPYSFLWSNGETSEDLSGIAAGYYDVTIADTNGCTATADITITQPDEIIITYVVSDEVLGNDGAIDITITGGIPTYSIVWSNGEYTEDIDNLASGYYTVTVTDANLCIAEETIYVNPAGCLLTVTTIGMDVDCNGDSVGVALAIAENGTEPYTYLWDFGAVNDTVTDLPAGTYYVTITDSAGCIEYGSVTIAEPAAIVATFDITPILCNGGTASVTLDITGGTPPYSVDWSGANPDSLTAGMYMVYVTDTKGCIGFGGVSITEPALLTATITGFDALCAGTATGQTDLTVSGGTAPYTHLWDTGETTEDLSGLAAGYYVVTVTDINGCNVIADVTISEPDAIDITYVVTNEVLGNDGAIDITVTGGIVPYDYLWSNADTTEDIGGLTADIYSVTVTDLNGCSEIEFIAVNNDSCTLVATLTGVDITCNGYADGMAYVTLTGAALPVTLYWNTGDTTDTIASLQPGSYCVTVTDNDGCNFVECVDIYEPLPLEITFSTTDDDGSGNGTATAIVTGGIAPYSYLWSDSSAQITETAVNLTFGQYSVIVTDDNGCQISDTTYVDPVNIIEISDIFTAELYPNPFTDKLTLSVTTNKNERIKIQIFDGTGKAVRNLTSGLFTGENTVTIDMSHYASGIYTVKLLRGEQITTWRVIKSNN
ncbi:MAG: T9SS type A sorting domain-containing protein [Bacteroidia bacterium]|nr:T9SS type A sorting domain-containing protein [Bacteroidia bacterium]